MVKLKKERQRSALKIHHNSHSYSFHKFTYILNVVKERKKTGSAHVNFINIKEYTSMYCTEDENDD